MGYTVELYAISLDRLNAELRAPTLDPAAIDAQADIDDEVLQNWSALAGTVADAIGGAGGELVWPLSGYLLRVVQQLGSWYGSFWHTSSGGEEFRSHLLAGSVSAVFGPEVALHLVNRDLLNLSWSDYPMFGWLSNAELRAVSGVTELPPGVDEDDHDVVWTLVDAFDRAASTGQDLISIYG